MKSIPSSSIMSNSLPYSTKDVDYDNAKLRHRSFLKVLLSQLLLTKRMKYECTRCSTGKFLALLIISGVVYLLLSSTGRAHSDIRELVKGNRTMGEELTVEHTGNHRLLLRRAPKLLPRLIKPGDTKDRNYSFQSGERSTTLKWLSRQQSVKDAFIHAWSGYRNYALGFDELMPLSRRGTDGLGGLGATVVDAIDTAMIMQADDIVNEASSWISGNLSDKISEKGNVNLFETTIRVLGGLLSAYHLSGGKQWNESMNKWPNPVIYLDNARNLADRMLSAFTSSPTSIPFSDVVLRDRSAHASPDGLSSTSEVSTLQLEFNYLSVVTGDTKYGIEAMKVLQHMKTLARFQGLVPIFISPHSGEFVGQNIRLGSRGDSYYEYLLKVWLQHGVDRDHNTSYLHHMYEEAMKGVKHLLVRKSIPNGLVFVGELPFGPDGDFSPKMDHLVCFLPGLLALGATKGLTKENAMKENQMTFEDFENLQLAEDLAKTCFEMHSVTSTGISPEIVHFHTQEYFEKGMGGGNKSCEYVNDILVKPGDRHNLLRPETVESFFVLYRITRDMKYREWGWSIFEAFEKHTKLDSGYTSLDDVTSIPPGRRDKMETFFLGETLKYLYLLFGDVTVLPLDKVVFNTEAHPFPVMGFGGDWRFPNGRIREASVV